MEQFFQELREKTTAEIHFDRIHKEIYSVDASIFEIEPLGILIPKNKTDLLAILKIANKYQLPLIPRGAATGIAGGCLGKALIVDTSKYLNKILHIDYANEYAICEPGVVQDRLNERLAVHGYRLGPDTSTGNRATIGGMVANNSAGSHSLLYGRMSDALEEVELALVSGDLIHFRPTSDHEWAQKCTYKTIEGHIYRELARIKQEYKEAILKDFPKVQRRVSGYNLDELMKPLNVAKLIAGSEGTLGIVTEIKVKITKAPKVVGLCILHFSDMQEAMQSIQNMLAFHPIALEMIDDKIIAAGRHSAAMRNKLFWLQGDPKTIFVTEFAGSSQDEVKETIANFEQAMKQQKVGFARVILTDPSLMSQVWELRKSGLGLLLSKRSYSRAIAFIEDFALPPDQLPSFVEKFQAYLHRLGKEAGIYGHVGAGCLHVRPYIDLRQPQELKLMEMIMRDVAEMLLAHGGVLSGEHGDGLIRTWLNKKMFGATLYQAFIALKAAFDPENRMNPGKIVEGQPLLKNLRLDPETQITQIDTFLNFKREGGFALAVDLCNGNGQCRKSEKLMCPSFQVTQDEYDTTRARAQSLRAIVNGHAPIESFVSQELYEVLDLCVECKGCKTECPSSVDMAKMKSEFLYHYHSKHGYPLRSYLFGYIGTLNRWGSLFSNVSNSILHSSLSKWLLSKIGITAHRDLPLLAKEQFSTWARKNLNQDKSRPKIVLFNDTYTEFNFPEIGQAAVKVLEALGYHVIVPAWQCCGRPLLSKGLLSQSQKKAKELLETLTPYAKEGLPIIGLEPSCILTLKDDFESLCGEKAHTLAHACITFDEFLNNHLKEGRLPLHFSSDACQVLVHGHCHQKSLVGIEPTLNVLRAVPGFEVSEIKSGCCGVAGSFGYEKEHYAFSMQIGELHLLPTLRKASIEALVVADGTSCRSQIHHGTNRTAKHLAEVLADRLIDLPLT